VSRRRKRRPGSSQAPEKLKFKLLKRRRLQLPPLAKMGLKWPRRGCWEEKEEEDEEEEEKEEEEEEKEQQQQQPPQQRRYRRRRRR
jgi:hypothetical protein